MSDGTPFDDKPGSDPADDFLKQHGGNFGDPLAGSGSGRAGFSPANDGAVNGSNSVGQGPSDQQGTADQSGGSTATGEGNGLGGTRIYCGSDYAGTENLGKKGDDCVAIEYDGEGNYKTQEDEKMHREFMFNWMPTAEDWNESQQYEGEGGYTGGGGRGANNLNFGSARRMAGKVVGSSDQDAAGLGHDTGGRKPARFEAIEKFVARGGKVRGKAGYQGGDSGLGQDVGGAAGQRISELKSTRCPAVCRRPECRGSQSDPLVAPGKGVSAESGQCRAGEWRTGRSGEGLCRPPEKHGQDQVTRQLTTSLVKDGW